MKTRSEQLLAMILVALASGALWKLWAFGTPAYVSGEERWALVFWRWFTTILVVPGLIATVLALLLIRWRKPKQDD